ncbi:MAG: hypothetical protein RLT05_10180 [Bauldia litoralis]
MIRFLFLALLLATQPAFANHPGERLDDVVAEKEPAFEIADCPSMPDLDVVGRNGDPLLLGDLHDQIVVLSFVPHECGEPCAEQQAALAAVQAQVNVSPMKEMVTFVTVHDANATIEAPWDGANWRLVVPSDGATAAAAVGSFASLSDREGALGRMSSMETDGTLGFSMVLNSRSQT